VKAIIMVAGVGSRLNKQVKHLPKCLLTFGGETILSRNLRMLREQEVSEMSWLPAIAPPWSGKRSKAQHLRPEPVFQSDQQFGVILVCAAVRRPLR